MQATYPAPARPCGEGVGGGVGGLFKMSQFRIIMLKFLRVFQVRLKVCCGNYLCPAFGGHFVKWVTILVLSCCAN